MATKRTSLSIPHDIYTSLEKRAAVEGRSVSNLVTHLLRQGLRPQPTYQGHHEEEVHDLPERRAAPQPQFMPRDEASAFLGG